MISLVFIGILVLMLIGVPIGFAIGGCAAFGFMAKGLSLTSFCTAFITSLDSFPLMAVPFFILSGGLMEKGGISQRLVDLAKIFVGKVYGSLCIITTLACAVFGSVSGSAPATEAAIGGIMLPEMNAAKYDKHFSAALISVAATIGSLIPPSLSLILYGAATSTSIGDLFIGGIVPGLLLTATLSITCYRYAKKHDWQRFEREVVGAKEIGKVIFKAIPAILMPVIILGGIYSGFFTPTEAGAVACFYAIIVTVFIYREMTLKKFYTVLRDSAKLTVLCLLVAAFCNPFARLLTLERLPDALSKILLSLSSNSYVFLLLLNIALLFVGMFVDLVPAMLVLAPIIYPIATQSYGIHPVHLGVVMSFNLILGLSTPPVGANLFLISSMTGLSFTKITQKIVRFLIIGYITLLIVTYFPIMTTWIQYLR